MRNIKIEIGILFLAFLLVNFKPVLGQVVTSVPPTTANNRYYNEVFSEIKRPGLSIIGFDNGGDHSKGYGLKQILNQVYVSGANEQKQKFKDILDISLEDIDLNPLNADIIEENSNKLQYRAFEALCSFVLEKNGISSSASNNTYGIPIRDHQTVINSFTSALMTLVNADKLTSPGNDYVKNVETYMNIARAIDLYLALENAYTKWSGHSGNTSWLLSQSEKQQMMERFIADIQDLYDNNVHKNYAIGVQEDDVEPGNRPLKGHLAIGFSVMAIQDASGWEGVDHRLDHTIWRASEPTTDNRHKHWMYQTDNGSRYWAEGAYYFNYALIDVVPFWHAIRANGMLGTVNDPFNSSWFLNPVEWLADISTPDGLTPPLDDGNKHRMSATPMLRWDATYGNAEVGKKFNYIYHSTSQNFGNSTWLTELAIPKTSQQTPINYNVDGAGPHKIIRHTDSQGKMHYVLMNGESGNMISRGEGHEQPDQLQLLYYVDDTSYLMDTGYDRTKFEFSPSLELVKSTWNDFKYHNVLHPEGANGLDPPRVSTNRIVSDHSSVDFLNYSSYGKVDLLSGSVQIQTGSTELSSGETLPAQYLRKTLFIHTDNSEGLDPYLIDINSHILGVEITDRNSNGTFATSSNFSDTQQYSHVAGTSWHKFTYTNQPNLYLYLIPIGSEFWNGEVSSDSNFELRERFNGGNNYFATNLKFKTKIYWTKEKTFISVFKIDNSEPDITPLFTVSNPPEHQAYLVNHTSDIKDVFVKRIKYQGNGGSNTHYNQSIDFDIEVNGNFIPSIRLPSSKDYGFARFRKNDGVWEIDSDFQINITRQPNTFVYTNGYSIGNKNFPSNSKIYIADNATVSVNGDVTMQPGTNVYLGSDAVLKVNAGGTITADGTTFRTISGSTASSERWKHIKLLTDYSQTSQGNTFTNCTFEGAEKALYSASYANLVERSTFSNNHTAVYSTSDLIELRGVTMENGTNGIVSRGTGSVRINSVYNTSGFDEPSEITGKTKGIRIYDNGSAYVHHTKFSGNNYHVYSNEQGRLYAGKYESDGSKGYNDFIAASMVDIYNAAVTSSGGTWTAQANYNWWGYNSPPSSSRFSGSVDRYFPLSCDPTDDGEYCDPQGSGGGGGGGDDEPCIIGSPGCPGPTPEAPPLGLPSLITSTTSNPDDSQAAESSTEEDTPPEWVTTKVNSLLAHINEKPEDPRLYNLVQEIYHLLQEYDTNGTFSRQIEFEQRMEHWMSLYLRNKGVTSTLSEDLPDPDIADPNAPLLSYPSVIDRLGRATVLLNIDRELRDENYTVVHKLVDAWRPYIDNDDDQASLLAAKAVAWEQTGQFGKALGAYESLELLKQAAKGQSDYAIIKSELADSMAARQQVKSKVPEVETVAKTGKEIPEEFDLLSPYPNPFNPTTVVPFTVPSRTHVNIEVYDMIGRRVAILTNRNYDPGTYQVTFNAEQLASGIYFIRTEMNNQLFNQKVTLIK